MPRWLSLLIFAVFSLGTQALIHYYLWRRLVSDTGIGRPWRRRATWALIVLGASIPVTLFLSRVLPIVGSTAGWVALLWMPLSGLTFLALMAIDLGKTITRLSLFIARRGGPELPANPDRRAFLARATGGAALLGTTGAVGLGVIEARGRIGVVDVELELPRLPPAMDRFTIVQITDLHVGYTVTRDFVAGIVAQVNALEPDLIAITGDMADGTPDHLRDAVAPIAELRAGHGVFFVTGNHEYYSGADAWIAEMRRLGVRVLRNERVDVSRGGAGFDLAGIDDFEAARFGHGHGADLPAAVAGRDASRALVLLAHQPRQVADAVAHGVDLQLSGHTHGGQVWPWHYIVAAQQGGLLAGLSRHGDTWLYISRGTGYWGPPVRIAAPAEITRVILRAGQPAAPA